MTAHQEATGDMETLHREKVAVMGSGSWGTALAVLLAENGHDVAPVSYTHLDVYKRQAGRGGTSRQKR